MLNLKKIITFSGKGGVGKTTALALFLKYILENKNKLARSINKNWIDFGNLKT